MVAAAEEIRVRSMGRMSVGGLDDADLGSGPLLVLANFAGFSDAEKPTDGAGAEIFQAADLRVAARSERPGRLRDEAEPEGDALRRCAGRCRQASQLTGELAEGLRINELCRRWQKRRTEKILRPG